MPDRNVQRWGNSGRGDGCASCAAFPLIRNSRALRSNRCILRHHCRDLAVRALAMDRGRHGGAVGFQEPVLRIFPFSLERAACRRIAVLESVPLRRASERRRSAIADLRAGLLAVGVVRPRSVHPRVRYSGLRASAGGRARHRRHRLACGMAGRGQRARGLRLHVRRRGVGAPAAYRDDPELRVVPGRAPVAAACAGAPFDRV